MKNRVFMNNQIKQDGDRKLLIALGISIVIVLFFIVFKAL